MLMNAATTLRPTGKASLSTTLGSFITSFRAARAARQARARLHAELSQYSDRELSDMNLSRADISDMVHNWQPG